MQNKIKIILADDEDTFRNSTADLLRNDGYICDTAVDSEDALNKIKINDYNVLVSDIKMPGNEQLELILKISEMTPSMAIILVTGYPTTQTAIKSIELPVTAYLTKPFEYEELVTAIENTTDYCHAQKMLQKTEKRLDDWGENIVELRKQMQKDSSPLFVNAFYALTVGNIISSLEDLQTIATSSSGYSPGSKACHMFDCSRITTLVDTLNHAVDVLEKTRTSFKSKELFHLRKSIEKAVASATRQSPAAKN